jgi:predicted Ser/Thr protein kinase
MIELAKMPQDKKGLFGTYTLVDKDTGVKIFYHLGLTIKELWSNKTLDSVRVPENWNSVLDEAIILKQAQTSNISPKYYGFNIVKVRNKYYPAILMEHIEGKNLVEWQFKQFLVKSGKIVPVKNQKNIHIYEGEIQIHIRETLAKVQVSHNDLHYNNVFISKDKTIQVIDFTSDRSFSMLPKQSASYNNLLTEVSDEFNNEYEKITENYALKIKNKDVTLYNQAAINSILNKHWNNVYNPVCDNNQINFYMNSYNEERINKITKYVQRECYKQLKLKFNIEILPTEDNAQRTQIKLLLSW